MSHSKITKAKSYLTDKKSAIKVSFFQSFYGRVSKDEIDPLSPSEMARVAEQHFDLTQQRSGGDPVIDVESQSKAKARSKNNKDNERTRLNIVYDNRPFLVESVTAAITQHYKFINTLVHTVIYVKRDKNGKITKSSAEYFKDGIAQSHVYIKLEGTVPDSQIPAMKSYLYKVINDVYYATNDWQLMKQKLRECQQSLNIAPSNKYSDAEIEEYIYFIEYLHKDNFTLLGFREYMFKEKKGKIISEIMPGQSLGVLRDEVQPVFINADEQGLSEEQQEIRHQLPPLTIAKVNKKSTVHRPVHMDSVAVKKFDKKGNVIGEYLFIGLFTSVTYSRSIQDVPYLRMKADMVTRMSGFEFNSHDYRALRHILEKYPRDELFQIDAKHLLNTALSILTLQERQRIALYTRRDPFRRFISCLVYIPRDRYDTRMRIKFGKILEEELNGECGSFYTNLDDSPLARVMYVINIDKSSPPDFDNEKLEAKLQEAGRLWSEKLISVLRSEDLPDSTLARYIIRYEEAFPTSYQEVYAPKNCVYDIQKIEETLAEQRLSLDLYKPDSFDEDKLRLKMYQVGKPVTLSAVLPLLENMGLRVISERPFEIKPNQATASIWMHDFVMQTKGCIDVEKIGSIKNDFEEALLQIWYEKVEDDDLNKLVLTSGLNWRDTIILRTYVRYMRQMRIHIGMQYVMDTLTNHPKISELLVRLFKARLDPAQQKDSKTVEAGCLVEIDHELENVKALDEDWILRTILQLIRATLRTNFYCKNKRYKDDEYLSIKLDSGAIDALPAPKPFREIFVYSPRVEGIHLRGDEIARGGLRWSDRPTDFRTEVLDLMKAQQVKNAVIVPMGSKGGFYVKKPPLEGGREAFIEEGIACYKIFIRGLLDITDNRQGSKVIHPKDVVIKDKEDPYLVVAADKGTATFSDIANSLSKEYKFWLGDAFASGGSAGYDHKKMGITARGAWESVKRHFRELNHDTQSQDFNVIGVGDMGGDVFGNGMILSEHIKLLGAFNHLHIFCDPDPDPVKSFKERQRLFDEVKGWDHYKEKVLSKGGRIYSRSDKSLELTPEIKECFGIEEDRVTPIELIRVMLKSRTDLLWFGGIGTYIKSTDQTHADVGDKANDALRVNAGDIRAKVIGEGANLGITQKARVALAQRGIRLNADFIDNSAGVDCSDHEVNIKILLSDVMRKPSHGLDDAARDKLLAEMTDEVAQLVLRDNYQQVQGLSLTETQSSQLINEHASFIENLEKRENLDRTLECLPDAEQIEERITHNKGLCRPELAILTSYAKILLTRDILGSDIPDQKLMAQEWLINYFPVPLREKYKKEIGAHRLARSIIATTLANEVTNRMGPTFIKHIMIKTGASSAEVVRSWLIVREVFELQKLWEAIEGLDNQTPASVQLDAMQDIQTLVERETIWFLTKLRRKPDLTKDSKIYGEGIKALRQNMNKVITKRQQEDLKRRKMAAEQNGLPENIAHEIALIPTLATACDLIRIHMDSKKDIETVASLYFDIGSHFHMDWLRNQARHMVADDKWTIEALDGLIEQLYSCQAELTVHILHDIKTLSAKVSGKETVLSIWLKENNDRAAQIDPIFATIRNSGNVDIAMLIIAEQRLRHLFGG